LEYLATPRFEVVCVAGPTGDGTAAVLADWANRIKVARNPVSNLSISRNIGIGLATGEIIAFLDDDAIPEAEWLDDLAAAFEDPTVGCAGGFVYNPDGVTFQYRYATVDRLGRADLSWQRPAPELSFPFTANFPHPLGANSAFRREVLLAVGGFDEEYEYYLDETDVVARVIDAGWRVAQLDCAYVHHKFLPNAVRNEDQMITSFYSIIKNHIYFGLVNGLAHHALDTVIGVARERIEMFRHHIDEEVASGRITEDGRTKFRFDVDRAWRDGLVRGLAGRRAMGVDRWSDPPPAFLPFRTLKPAAGTHCFCFISQVHPPGPVGGVGHYIHTLAQAIATIGHQVHLLTHGQSSDRVDFEQGVWVHRVVPAPEDAESAATLHMPNRVGPHIARLQREVEAISDRRKVDAVYAPIGDCEGLALLGPSNPPLVTSLQSPHHFWMEVNPGIRTDLGWMRDYARLMLGGQQRLLRESSCIHAISGCIVTEIEKAYGVVLDRIRTFVIPLGLEDWTRQPYHEPGPLGPGTLRVVFVGRLESRKGIDVLLQASQRILARHPQVHLDVVGNDRITIPSRGTYREQFEVDLTADAIRDRVHFHGAVSEERLRGFYRACDVVVTPSRFASFGRVLIEGMMFGKAVIGCRAGGMVDVVEEEVSGLLAEPGDIDSLTVCLERLIVDAELRVRLGRAARARYEVFFTASRMAERVADMLLRAAEFERADAFRPCIPI
jgi:glycosyltransferase involved in cell wall biosynthesis